MTHNHALDRLALARLLDARVRRLVRRSCRSEALVAGLLSTISAQGLDRALGYKNLNAYARAVADWDATKTSRMVTLVRDLRELPEMRKAFFTGKLPWTKACVAAAAAVLEPESDALWTQRAHEKSRDELEQMKREAANEPALIRVVVYLTPEGKARFDDARDAFQREHGRPLDPSEVVSEACHLAVKGGAIDAGPRPLVALGVCDGCGTVTHGSSTVSLAEAGPALCNSDVVDFTVTPPARRPTISPRVVAEVFARDQGRCRVPGCSNRTWIDLHHEGGWRAVGHDPARVVSLCTNHHRARHEELLKIVFDSGRVTFTLADGEVLGEVDLRVLPSAVQHRAAPSGRPQIARAQSETSNANESDAKKALVSLGFRVADAKRAIEAAGSWPTTELLVKAALQRMPTRREAPEPAQPHPASSSRPFESSQA